MRTCVRPSPTPEILGVNNAALIFPKLNSDVLAAQEVRVADGSEVKIQLWQVDVMAPDWTELDKDLSRLANLAGIGSTMGLTSIHYYS